MKPKTPKQLHDTDDIHFSANDDYGTDQELDPTPITHGSVDLREHFDGGKTRHKGGVHDGFRDTSLAENHTGDFVGDHNAADQSQRGADSLKILEQPQRIRDAYAGIEAERDDPDVEDEDDAKPTRRSRR